MPKRGILDRRNEPSRDPYEVVLIACEGAKTEPNYFRGLCAAYGLSSANVKISPRGNDPLSIVKFAISEMETDKDLNRAFCVFDRDGHKTYDAAIRKISSHRFGKERRLVAIDSNPCFELWMLLHYGYSTQAHVSVGGKSACDRIVEILKSYIPAYAKGHTGVFDILACNLDAAIKHAKRLESHNTVTQSTNPATKVHKLVEYLRNLKNPK
jgi:hypothetical protein